MGVPPHIGVTIASLIPEIEARGAQSVRVTSLLEKRTDRSNGFEAHYAGFSIPDKFVIGYSLDFNEVFRCGEGEAERSHSLCLSKNTVCTTDVMAAQCFHVHHTSLDTLDKAQLQTVQYRTSDLTMQNRMRLSNKGLIQIQRPLIPLAQH